MGAIDRKRVKRSFGRQAGEYDRHADVQKKVMARLLGILRGLGMEPKSILDVGTGTGTLLGMLTGVYRDVSLFGVDLAPEMSRLARRKMEDEKRVYLLSADAEQLPFDGEAFDMVLSTSTFQWLNTLDPAFAEAYRILAPGGIFCFAMFGENTLRELRNSYRRALASDGRLKQDHTHAFRTVREVEEALEAVGFSGCSAVSERYREYHDSVPALLRSLKKIGAGNAAPSPARGLAGRRVMARMIDTYEREYAGKGRVPVTYEVIYAMGRKVRS